MTHDEAMQCALGYAWGREDASGTATVAPADSASGIFEFAETFAGAWDSFNAEKIGHMIPVRSAYERWNETRGRTIWNETDERINAERAARAGK